MSLGFCDLLLYKVRVFKVLKDSKVPKVLKTLMFIYCSIAFSLSASLLGKVLRRDALVVVDAAYCVGKQFCYRQYYSLGILLAVRN